jgi:hypothetical protein
MKAFYCCLLCICCLTLSRAQGGLNNPYPFTLENEKGRFGIVADVQDRSMHLKYHDLFSKYGYEGNGYSWAGMIALLLEKQSPELLKKLDFEPEVGAFNAYAKSDIDRQQFIHIVSPVFSNLKTLEDFIKSADRSRIDD